jgi:hypothetical protein
VQSTTGIVLRGRYAKADSLSWPFWDNSDAFRVVLPQSGSFNVGITGFSKNVDLQLFTLNGRLIASSSLPGTTPDSITLKSLAAGTYVVKVSLKVPFLDVTARTNYQIFMSRSETSDILTEEANLGRLGNAAINRSGTVNSNDTSDIYRFSLAAPSALNLNLNGLRSNANIRLIRDSNRNGLIDTNEIVASSTQSGANPESIDMRWLASGDYFVQVYQQGSGATNYSLRLSRSTPIPLSFRAAADAYVRDDLEVRANDNYGSESILGIGTGRGSSIGPAGTADAMRSLLRFDLTGVSGTVNRATLRLTLQGLSTSDNSPFTIGVYKVTQPWQEGNGAESNPGIVPGSTDPNTASGVAWSAVDENNQAQPAFSSAAIANQVSDPTTTPRGTTIEWDITALVRDWLLNPASNYGLMLRDVTTSGTFRFLAFGSREADLYRFPNNVSGPRLDLQLR